MAKSHWRANSWQNDGLQKREGKGELLTSTHNWPHLSLLGKEPLLPTASKHWRQMIQKNLLDINISHLLCCSWRAGLKLSVFPAHSSPNGAQHTPSLPFLLLPVFSHEPLHPLPNFVTTLFLWRGEYASPPIQAGTKDLQPVASQSRNWAVLAKSASSGWDRQARNHETQNRLQCSQSNFLRPRHILVQSKSDVLDSSSAKIASSHAAFLNLSEIQTYCEKHIECNARIFREYFSLSERMLKSKPVSSNVLALCNGCPGLRHPYVMF